MGRAKPPIYRGVSVRLKVQARSIWIAYAVIVSVLLLAPMIAVLGTAFGASAYPTFPPKNLTLKWFPQVFSDRTIIEPFMNSVILAFITSAIVSVGGGLAAIGLFRYRFRGRDALLNFTMSPLVLPQVLLGISILQFYALLGFQTNLVILMLAHILITIPYVVRLVGASLSGLDRTLELAARNLGAGPLTTFLRITLPLVRAGVVGGAIFSFILSFENFTMTVFLTTPGVITLPVRIFLYMDWRLDSYIFAAGSLLIFLTAVMLLVLERTIGVGRVWGVEPGRGR
ncbi:MAG: ABC transporter permease [Chloroflexi bacterium]|nr:ABC transporter permease [Chloroflexota bacterium]